MTELEAWCRFQRAENELIAYFDEHGDISTEHFIMCMFDTFYRIDKRTIVKCIDKLIANRNYAARKLLYKLDANRE